MSQDENSISAQQATNLALSQNNTLSNSSASNSSASSKEARGIQRKKVPSSMVVINVIGTLFIIISALLTFLGEKDRGLLTNILATVSGAVGGVLVGVGITGIINVDPLERISEEIISIKGAYIKSQQATQEEIEFLKGYYKKALGEISVAKLSSENRQDHKARLDSLSHKRLYRYFETLNTNGEREWRRKEILFTISADHKRITARIDYKTKSYEVQAACIGKHLLYISEEVNNLDQPMIDIYLDLQINSPINSSGISIRYPWEQRNRLICAYAILSERILLEESDWQESQDGSYWILKDNQQKSVKEDLLKNLWRQYNGNANCFVHNN